MQIIEPDYSKVSSETPEIEDMTHNLLEHNDYGNGSRFYAIGLVQRYDVVLLSGKRYLMSEAQVLRQALEDADGPYQEEVAKAKALGQTARPKYVVVNVVTEGKGH